MTALDGAREDCWAPPQPSPPSLYAKIRWVLHFSWVGCLETPRLIYNLLLRPAEIYDLLG